MRMMLTASIPNEPFNSLVRSGEVGHIIRDILAELKPEATYFVEEDRFRIAMVPEDLGKAGLEALGKKWK